MEHAVLPGNPACHERRAANNLCVFDETKLPEDSMSDEYGDRQPVTDTRRIASAVRIYMERAVEEAVGQMKYDGATLEDCEAELQVLADFVRVQVDGLRAAWPELLEADDYADWLLSQRGTVAEDVDLEDS